MPWTRAPRVRSYISIPQVNVHTQKLAIESLHFYASVSNFFVVIAPRAFHEGKRTWCDETTYNNRGWCRLEQWARMSEGVSDMFLYADAHGKYSLTSMQAEQLDEWRQKAILVFEGEYAMEVDKKMLVDTVLGLYAIALMNAQDQHDDNDQLLPLIQSNMSGVFPKYLFGNMPATLERVLNNTMLPIEADAARRAGVDGSAIASRLSQDKEQKRASRRASSAFRDLQVPSDHQVAATLPAAQAVLAADVAAPATEETAPVQEHLQVAPNDPEAALAHESATAMRPASPPHVGKSMLGRLTGERRPKGNGTMLASAHKPIVV